MLRYSTWPVGKDKTVRLERFHESEYWPRVSGAPRRHALSRYWQDAVTNIRTVVGDNTVKIESFSHFLGPEQLEEIKSSRTAGQSRRSKRAVMQLGYLGKHVKTDIWTGLWRPFLFLAAVLFRAHDVASKVRADTLAREAFTKIHDNDRHSIISFKNLENVPVLAEQSHGSLWMVLYISSIINTLGPYIKDLNVNRIVEIGPGWGGLSICFRHLFNCKFILIDLPEMLSSTFAMISYYCPNSVVVLPHEVEGMKDDIESADFVLLCPEQASLIPSESVDLAINTSSFQEMTYPIIEDYFKLVCWSVRKGGFFYCLNEKSFRRHKVGGRIEFDKYPWDPAFEDIFYEEFPFGRLSRSNERTHRLQVKRTG